MLVCWPADSTNGRGCHLRAAGVLLIHTLHPHPLLPPPHVQSSYKSDLLAGHVRVGRRGVCQSPEAMAAVSSGGRGVGMGSVKHCCNVCEQGTAGLWCPAAHATA